MKTLLIATDFSPNAGHAATYGYALAQQLKARLLLCHALNVPAEIPQTGMVAWPMEVYDDMMQDSYTELEKLKATLLSTAGTDGYQPEIICIHEAGFVADVINDEAAQNQADLIIIGAHGNGAIGTLMIGNHSRKLIEGAKVPLLLIPAGAELKNIQRIAFGSDFKQPEKDMAVIDQLVTLTAGLDAELVLAHIEQDVADAEYSAVVKQLLMQLIGKLSYKKVSYKVVKSNHVENGLEWLIRHAHIDMMVMAHREHNFFDQLINGSHTQKAAGEIPVPLLVLKVKN